MPAVLNAANEESVAAFLDGRIPFPAIAQTVAEVMDGHIVAQASSLEAVLDADAWARRRARESFAARPAGAFVSRPPR